MFAPAESHKRTRTGHDLPAPAPAPFRGSARDSKAGAAGNQALLRALGIASKNAADEEKNGPDAGVPESKKKQEAPCAGGKEAKASACIQPVVIADDDGKKPTAAVSADKAKSIWKKCCIDLSVKAATTVSKTAYKTLDESPDEHPTEEEKKLFKDAGASTCIQVFVPEQLTMAGKTGKDVNGGGGTYDYGTANPKIVLVEGAVGGVLAHEVGHAFGITRHIEKTVMQGTGSHSTAPPDDVSADICSDVRKGSVLTKGKDADCCKTIP